MNTGENQSTYAPNAEAPSLAHIADRVINRPLMIHPDKAAIILDVLHGRLGVTAVAAPPMTPLADRFRGSRLREDGSYRMNASENGVALIPIIGSLVNRGAWIGSYSGMTSYEGVGAQLREAMSDPEVRGIVLDIDSPGGEALGVTGLAAAVREARAQKPVIAVVNDMAASAAYNIAAQATEIVVSPTSITGSIGVVMVHQNVAGKMEKQGVDVTIIHAGAHKVDGHPFGPLSDAVRADLQAEVMKHYSQFVQSVAAGRNGRLSEEGARATEARVFLGSEAVERGLADRVASLDEVLAGFGSRLSIGPGRGAHSSRRSKMDDNTNTLSQQQHEARVAEATAAARTEAAAAERARIAAILTHDEAEGRTQQAITLALETDLSAEQAGKVLASTPKAKEGSGIASIEERSKEGAGATGGASESDTSASIDAAWSKVLGKINKSAGVKRA